MVEVQVRVDDDVDAGEVEGLLAQWDEAGVKVGQLRVQLGECILPLAGAKAGELGDRVRTLMKQTPA